MIVNKKTNDHEVILTTLTRTRRTSLFKVGYSKANKVVGFHLPGHIAHNVNVLRLFRFLGLTDLGKIRTLVSGLYRSSSPATCWTCWQQTTSDLDDIKAIGTNLYSVKYPTKEARS